MKVAVFEQPSPAQEWNELARKICKRNEENKLNNQEVLDEIDESEEEYDDEEPTDVSIEGADHNDAEIVREKTTKKPVTSTKVPKEKSTAKPKVTTSAPPSVVDSNNENDESEADDDYNYDDDDDEDREDERTDKDKNVIKEVIIGEDQGLVRKFDD